MKKYIKGIIINFLIITGLVEGYDQDVNFHRFKINDGPSLNTLPDNQKGRFWIIENCLCQFSEVKNGILSRSVHLRLLSFNNYRNS